MSIMLKKPSIRAGGIAKPGYVRPPVRRALVPSRAAAADGPGGAGEGGGPEDYASMAARLNNLLVKPKMDGKALRQLVLDKWGRSYDIRLNKRGNKMYLQVMWKFVEQQSFHLTEEQYMMQLDAVADYLNDWGVVETVKAGIKAATPRGPGYNMGGGAKCISIPLDVDLGGGRSAEWD